MTHPEQKFEKLISDIEDAMARIEANDAVDLGALNLQITETCSAAAIAEATNKEMQLPMAKLISKLEELAQCIDAYQQRLKKAN